MAGFYPLTIDQGATLDRLLTWTNAAGTPYDLSGWSAKMQVRDAPGGTLLQACTTADGTIVLGGVAGTIRLLLAAAVTSAWTWRSGVYDLELTNPSAAVTRLLQGPVTVSPEVTL